MNSIDDERVPDETDKEEEAKWVCEHCGKSTFEVDYDYIGSNYNHLGCELEIELKDWDPTKGDKRVRNDRRKGDRREKNYSQKKHEEKVFGEYAEDIDEQAYAQGRKSSYKK